MSVFTIWVVTGVLFYLAIFRIVDQDYQIDADPMLVTACLAVLVNIVSVLPFFHILTLYSKVKISKVLQYNSYSILAISILGTDRGYSVE